MIPFAILAGILRTKTKQIEIRIIELSVEYFTLRLPLDFLRVEEIDSIELNFYISNKYKSIMLTEFKAEILDTTELNDYAQEVVIYVQDEGYEILVKQFSEEYIEYVNDRLVFDIDDISRKYAGMEFDNETFSDSRENQVKKWMKESETNFEKILKSDVELSVLLSDNEMLLEYISLGKDKILSQRIKKYLFPGEQKGKLYEKTVESIFIGNEFCINLLPDINMLDKVFERAGLDNIPVVFLLPPVPESRLSNNKDYLSKIKELSYKRGISISVRANDIGTLVYAKTLFDEVYKGILFYKKKKDPRIGDFLDETEKEIFLPFYQMNTATFCTVHSTYATGMRGKTKRVDNCNGICLRTKIIYPDSYKIVSKYNSIFGINLKAFDSFSDNDGKRVVINL